MRDRLGREIEVGDWVKAEPLNPLPNRVPKGTKVVGRVVSTFPSGDRMIQWTTFGPVADIGAGPQYGMQMTHADRFDPASAEIILKWGGTEPHQNAYGGADAEP